MSKRKIVSGKAVKARDISPELWEVAMDRVKCFLFLHHLETKRLVSLMASAYIQGLRDAAEGENNG
jgi:hypothetical protein